MRKIILNYRYKIKVGIDLTEVNNVFWYLDNFENLTYKEYCEGLEICGKIIRRTQDLNSVSNELNKLRAVFKEELLSSYEECGVYKISEPVDLTDDEEQLLTKYGFYTNKGTFLLNNRFLIEVHDASGRLLTFIGWYPDNRKYITIATKYFSKKIDWFNLDRALDLSLNYFEGAVFVVEGIFDALTIDALGLPAIATMGSNVNNIKGRVLNLFDKPVLIPDGDEVGQESLNRWYTPKNATKVKMALRLDMPMEDENGVKYKKIKIKDTDDLIKYVDSDGVRESLLGIANSANPIEILK